MSHSMCLCICASHIVNDVDDDDENNVSVRRLGPFFYHTHTHTQHARIDAHLHDVCPVQSDIRPLSANVRTAVSSDFGRVCR